ncbi:hypothetical protein [Mesorhizobium sp. M2E.F.Ca.ET.209.01.1.1]|uniref:hypothetical protein n=1 Tax=Mesorhizobium sp. M2E.F.Ca.ET.209.01.1.1 TaxID=2500526 RepID=UPI001679CA12|nr:hypothetical protein [Mesorhizobium sp. M2E.F.Ca.ET.209.01.1.1]
MNKSIVDCKAARLKVVLPDHATDHTDPYKPPNPYLYALCSAGQQNVHIELAAATALMPLDVPKRNVPHQLGQITGQIVPRDVAIDAPDADQLPDLVGTV